MRQRNPGFQEHRPENVWLEEKEAGTRHQLGAEQVGRLLAGDCHQLNIADLRFLAANGPCDAQALSERLQELVTVFSDPQQYLLLFSPEARGIELRTFTREVMASLSRHLDQDLVWLAASHFNSHPHTHVVVRGRDREGEPVVIDQGLVQGELRAQAEDIATRLAVGSDRELLREFDRRDDECSTSSDLNRERERDMEWERE